MTAQGALLLDCDGVIAHSEPLNFSCWNDAYEQLLGIRLSGDYQQLVGLDLEGIHSLWHSLCCQNDKRKNIELSNEIKLKLLEVKNNLFYQRAETQLRSVEGIQALIQRAKQQALPIAVVSAALRKRLEFTLHSVGLEGVFDLILSGEDIPATGEPLKDYQRAARALSVPPEACIVVEDSSSGIRAARAAGIGCIYGITTSHDEASLWQAGADRVVSTLKEVALPTNSLEMTRRIDK